MEEPVPERSHRSAIIAFVGRPNSGKSTLLNTIIGEEISIVTPLPQTTRLNARGIYTTEAMQLVFVDTPGVHKGKHTINKAMLQEAQRAIDDDIDLLCYLVDCSRELGNEERYVAEMVATVKKAQVCIVFNKTDLVPSVGRFAKRFYAMFPDLEKFPAIPLSAVESDAKDAFLAAIDSFIPEGPQYFDPEDLTDSTMRHIAAEYLRKHIIATTSEEVPHAVFVEIDSYREAEDCHEIIATIHVETSGQRGIIVGKGGCGIAKVKKLARADLVRLTGVPVHLTCHVKVSPKWRDNAVFLRQRGVPFQP